MLARNAYELGSLADIAQRTDGVVIGDPSVRIASIAAVEDAESSTLTFATDERYLRAALGSRAAAILAAASAVDSHKSYAKPIVVVTSPRVALASLLAVFETPPLKGPFVDPSAAIDPSATVGAEVYIGRDVTVAAGAVIGARSVLGPGCIIAANAIVGEDCYIDTRAYVGERSLLGNRVTLKPQAVVGGQGFGWAFLDGGLRRIPQIGNVQLGDDVEIGSNTCVDRAQTGVTAIGEGTKIDNLVQIGHNCRIGKHCAIAAQCGLAGSTVVGDYVQMGGQVGIAGHLTIGSRVRIGARSAVWGNIADDMVVSGAPARAHRQTLKIQAYFRRLPELYERLKSLEKHAVNPSNPQQNSSSL
jgi:UDP-3-O-[3-hydroxymyristoyl] glucosamine N-acyltransferase